MSQDRLGKLKEKLSKGELEFLTDYSEFVFACDQCGHCCRNRDDILLTPYDIYNLVKATGKTVDEILKKYGNLYIGDGSRLPIVQLRYREEPDGNTTCYFLGQKDGKHYCRVNAYKPGVCRTFPLGKVTGGERNNPTKAYDVKYFCQECDDPNCKGGIRANKENIKQRLVDWVGGPEKKRLMDKYSEIFNNFMFEYISEFVDRKIEKKLDPISRLLFFRYITDLIYFNYDFNVGDDEFLDNMNFNLQGVLLIVKDIEKDNDYIKKTVAKVLKEKFNH